MFDLNWVVGIGRQTAISFAAEGCLKIAIADRDPIALDAAKAAIQQVAPAAEVVIAPMDVRLEQDVTEAVKATVDKFGRLDYAVNCAGSCPNCDLWDLWMTTDNNKL